MRPLLGLLIASSIASPACVFTSSVDLDRSLFETEEDAGRADASRDCGASACAPECTRSSACGEARCVEGACRCDHGLLCDGRCVDSSNDRHNCGQCGLVCEEDRRCEEGTCD